MRELSLWTPQAPVRRESGSTQLLLRKRMPTQHSGHRRVAPVTAGLRLSGLHASSDLPGYLSVAAYAAHTLSARTGLNFALTPGFIYSTLAWYTLINGATSAAQDKFEFDGIGSLVGPLFLAVQALGGIPRLHLSPWDTAASLFGLLLVKRLPAFQGSTLLWLGTLAAAVHQGLAAQWTVAAFGLAAAWRLGQGVRSGTVPLQEAAFAALAGIVAIQGAYAAAALAIFAGHIAASAIS